MTNKKTHCRQGHAFIKENTLTDSAGKRRCRICARARQRAYSERNREKERQRHHDLYWGNEEYRQKQLENGRKRQAEYRALKTFEERKNERLMRRYNLTLEDYQGWVDEQRGHCAICNKVPVKSKLVIDHDHDTGTLRGLLCTKCNTGLGKFDDDFQLLEKALTYLYTFDKYIKNIKESG